MSLLDEVRHHRGEIIAAARKHGIGNIRVFGSVSRGEEREDSDIDLLVDAAESTSLFDLMDTQEELERLIGRKVDIVTERGMFWYVRDKVLKEAQPL